MTFLRPASLFLGLAGLAVAGSASAQAGANGGHVEIRASGDIAHEAGLPAGVFNVVTGGRECGAALAAHPGLSKISFTGSTPTGKLVGTAAVQNMTRFSLELGGKNPAVMLADIDVEQAIQGALAGDFFGSNAKEAQEVDFYHWSAILRSVSAFEVYRKVYRDVDKKAWPAARQSVKVQLQYLAEHG